MYHIVNMTVMIITARIMLKFLKNVLYIDSRRYDSKIIIVIAGLLITSGLYLTVEYKHILGFVFVEFILFEYGKGLSDRTGKNVFCMSVIILMSCILSGMIGIFLLLINTGDENYNILEKFSVEYIGMSVNICLIMFYISSILQRIILKNKKFKLAEFVILVVVPIITITSINAEVIVFQNLIKKNENILILLMVMAGIVLINLISYYYYIVLDKEYKLEMQYALLLQQYAHMKENSMEICNYYQEANRMSHDFKHHLKMILSKVREQDDDGIREYIETVLHSTQKARISHSIYCDNPAVNYILNAAISKCTSQNIDCSCSITASLKDFYEMDLGLVLNNLLDNAMEASSKVKDAHIKVYIKGDNDIFDIQIMNSIKGSVLKQNPRLETTKIDKSRHGFGIQNVKSIVQKWNGSIEFYEQNHYFCCQIIVKRENIRKVGGNTK